MERVRLEEGENMMEFKDFEKNNNSHGLVVSYFPGLYVITNAYMDL
jgi:hypothetical protein